MSAQYVRPVYRFGELIDLYESINGSTVHNREATSTSYGPSKLFHRLQGNVNQYDTCLVVHSFIIANAVLTIVQFIPKIMY